LKREKDRRTSDGEGTEERIEGKYCMEAQLLFSHKYDRGTLF
jgi:hypothetical protein